MQMVEILLSKYSFIIVLLTFAPVNCSEYKYPGCHMDIVGAINLVPLIFFGHKQDNITLYQSYYFPDKTFKFIDNPKPTDQIIGAIYYKSKLDEDNRSFEFPNGFQLVFRRLENSNNIYYIHKFTKVILRKEETVLFGKKVKMLKTEKNFKYLNGSEGMLWFYKNKTMLYTENGDLQQRKSNITIRRMFQPKISLIFDWEDQLYAIDKVDHNKLYQLDCTFGICTYKTVSKSNSILFKFKFKLSAFKTH